MITNTASNTEITVLSVKKLPIAVMRPITSSATWGSGVAGAAANGRKKSPSAAALYGTREPPSSPANTEPNAVMQTRTVTTSAAAFPHVRSSTSDATESDFETSCHGTTPRTPTCMRR